MPSRPLKTCAAALLAALAVAGCKSSGSSGSCGSGETSNPDPPFCYKVPSGFTPKGDPIKRAGWFSIAYADQGGGHVDFIVRDLEGFDGRWKGLQGNAKAAKASDAKEGEFAGGKGKILTYSTPEKDPKFVVSAVLRGAKGSLECEAEYRASAPKPELVDICKSIHER